MRNNFNQLLLNKSNHDEIPKVKIAIAFEIYLDNKMMMITMVTMIKQK